MKNIVSRSFGAFAAGTHLPFSPRVVFDAPDDLGNGNGSVDPDKAAADKAAAEKAAADAAAAAEAAKAKEQEGKEKPGSDESLLREVMEKKKKLRETEAALEALKAENAKFAGINLDEVTALLNEKKDRERLEAEQRGEFERVKQMMAEDHKKEKEALEAQLNELRQVASSKDQVIDNLTIGQSFSGSTFIREEMTLTPTKARILYGSHFEVVDGKIVAYDKPAGAANRTPLVDAAGDNLPFDEAFKRIIEADPERETLIRAKMQPGAQSRSQSSTEQKKPVEQGVYGISRIKIGLEKK